MVKDNIVDGGDGFDVLGIGSQYENSEIDLSNFAHAILENFEESFTNNEVGNDITITTHAIQ